MKYIGMLYFALWMAVAVGWCVNIWKLIEVLSATGAAGTLEIIRVVGIFLAPLGSVLGFFV